MDPIKPTLTNVPEYLKQTERPKDYETALQQNEDLRFMCNAVYKAYLQYRNSMLKWQISAGTVRRAAKQDSRRCDPDQCNHWPARGRRQ